MTHCRQEKLSFQGINGKRVEGRFDGGKLSTDGGLLLVREVELRPSNIDASLGTEAALAKIVPRLRAEFPDAQIILRGDSGFTREAIMHFCEENRIDFVLGLARNQRLEAMIADELSQAKQLYDQTHAPARVYQEFSYSTIDSWSKERRVIGKAEHLEKGANPRFVVTTLKYPPTDLYETWYCKRGDAENRIKEQFQLFAHRTSSSLKRSNQLRLWFSTIAYLVMVLFKKYSLAGTTLEKAEPASIRTRLIKLAVKVSVSARRVYLSFAESFPLQAIFSAAVPSRR